MGDSCRLKMNFCHEICSANSFADALAKQGVDKVVPFVPSILCNCWA